MPDEEGLALAEAARVAASSGPGPLLEIGSYCGKSTLYLMAGIAAAAPASVLVSVDHHRGSEELQSGWPDHDPAVVDGRSGRIDTLPHWRRAIEEAGAEDLVVGIVGESSVVAALWREGLRLLFVDGGHGSEVAWRDYRGWAPHVAQGGLLAIHDVFPDPADGGRPPYELYVQALGCGAFVEEAELGCGSLRVLRRVAPGC
jgi:predicted O-methyltransferase YrrM